MELISDHSLNLLVATETWLTDSQMDNIWLEGTYLNKDQIRMLVNNRAGCRGVGIALIYWKEYSVKTIKNETKSSFQYSIWSVKAIEQTPINMLDSIIHHNHQKIHQIVYS